MKYGGPVPVAYLCMKMLLKDDANEKENEKENEEEVVKKERKERKGRMRMRMRMRMRRVTLDNHMMYLTISEAQ